MAITKASKSGFTANSQQKYDSMLAGNNAFLNGWIARTDTLGNMGGVAVDSSGVVYSCGSRSNGSYNDVYLTKSNNNGSKNFSRIYTTTSGGIRPSAASGVALDSSGNIYLVGNARETGSDKTVTAFIKLNSSGTIQFNGVYNGQETNSFGQRIAIDPSDNSSVIVGYENVSGTSKGFFKKITPTGGNDIQVQLTNSSSAGAAYAVAATSSAYYVGGQFASNGMTTIKFNTSGGTIAWQRTLSGAAVGTGGQYNGGIAVDSSGNVYRTQGNGARQIWIWKYNSSGTLQWQRTISDPTLYGQSFDLAIDSSNNIYVCGYWGIGSDSGQVFIAKYDTNGTIQWQRLFGTNNYEIGYAIAINGDYMYPVSSFDGFVGNKPNANKLPTSGAGAGSSWVLDGFTFTYTASSFTEAAGSLTDSAGAITTSNPNYAINTSFFNTTATAGTYSYITI